MIPRYDSRSEYRRPPAVYRHMQWLANLLTRLGLSPRGVVVLEVAGRKTGRMRRTSLVKASSRGHDYLVGISGESEWVRNVRAAGGAVTIVRGRGRHRAHLVEVPVAERPEIIAAYILRWGRTRGSKEVAEEAARYFGIGGDVSLEEIETVAGFYPVFEIGWIEARSRR